MSTLARSVNYSITELGEESQIFPPLFFLPLVILKIDLLMLGVNHSQLLEIEVLVVPPP